MVANVTQSMAVAEPAASCGIDPREYLGWRRLLVSFVVATVPATLVLLTSVDFFEGDFPLPFACVLALAGGVAPVGIASLLVAGRRWRAGTPLSDVLSTQWTAVLLIVVLLALTLWGTAAMLLLVDEGGPS